MGHLCEPVAAWSILRARAQMYKICIASFPLLILCAYLPSSVFAKATVSLCVWPRNFLWHCLWKLWQTTHSTGRVKGKSVTQKSMWKNDSFPVTTSKPKLVVAFVSSFILFLLRLPFCHLPRLLNALFSPILIHSVVNSSLSLPSLGLDLKLLLWPLVGHIPVCRSCQFSSLAPDV